MVAAVAVVVVAATAAVAVVVVEVVGVVVGVVRVRRCAFLPHALSPCRAFYLLPRYKYTRTRTRAHRCPAAWHGPLHAPHMVAMQHERPA
jgi:hypothetical protein